MKTTWILCLWFVSSTFVMGEPKPGQIDLSNVPALQAHRQQEYTFDTTTDPASWDREKPGMHVAFGSTDELYLRCEVPVLKEPANLWSASGWRGERLNAQILVWSTDSQEQIRFEPSDLQNEDGGIISKEKIRLHLVRYVLSNFPYQAKGFTCDVTNQSAYLLPDRLEKLERFALPARTVRPVWLAIEIPANARPGTYLGTLAISSLQERASLQLRIHVQPKTLPPPRDWKFRLDLWQNPWAVASYFQVTPWSVEHKALLKAHLKLYADCGGKYITTYAVHSPWSDNSFVLEGTMIGWTKTTAGSWKFDYSIFDQYVELAMEAGIRQAITIYTPVPWNHRFRYLEEKSGNLVYAQWPPNSERFKTFWNIFLDDLRKHLSKKGWLKKAYLGINENPLDVTLAAVKVIKENSQAWKITYAGDWHPELSALLDDYSVIINREPSARELQQRASQGLSTTFYVCCNPPQPNTFVFSAPVEAASLGWYAAGYRYDGFLRWAYDAWPADPMRDARHTLWPAGDCFLVYPGGNSSIRFEKLREGIVDFEKISLLRAASARSGNTSAKSLIGALDEHLRKFAEQRDHTRRDYAFGTLTHALNNGRKLIEVLSNDLSPGH